QNPNPTFSYDPARDRVIATAWASQEWLKSAPMAKIKDTAEEYCTEVFITENAIESRLTIAASLDDRLKAEKDMLRNCYVEFLSVSKVPSPLAAVFENGELTLK